MNVHCLDANIFLEIPIEEEDDGSLCTQLFDTPSIRYASKRIIEEVDSNYSLFIEAFNKLQKYFNKGNQNKRFISDRKKISNALMGKIRAIEDLIKKYRGAAKLHQLDKLKILFKKIVTERKNNIESELIPDSNNSELFNEVSGVMADDDDAWHITDSYTYSYDRFLMHFWSLDGHVIRPRRDIIGTLCTYSQIDRSQCHFDINHVREIDSFSF